MQGRRRAGFYTFYSPRPSFRYRSVPETRFPAKVILGNSVAVSNVFSETELPTWGFVETWPICRASTPYP